MNDASQSRHHSAALSAAEDVRLDTWVLEIADEVLGHQHEEGDGSFRFGENRALVVHPDGWFYDFGAGKGGSGGLALLALLSDLGLDDAAQKARQWLAAHEGSGILALSVEEAEAAEARSARKSDAERAAFLAEVWARTVDIKETPGWAYLTVERGLEPSDDDLKHIRWLPHARGHGPDAEGAMVAALIDNTGVIVALQLTYVTAAGAKSEIDPARRTHRGPSDWTRRGFLRLGAAGNPKAFVVEGTEDGLSLRQAGAERVLVLCGLARLGKPTLPFEVATVAIVRDADAPEAAGTAMLWRGVVRLACQLHSQGKVLVTTRPDVICPAKPSKDANDLLKHHGVKKVKALMESAQRIPPFSEFERKAIIEAACEVDNASYASGRDRIAALLEWRKANLDKARKDRIKERANANQAKLAERDTPWPDPVPDVAPLLDEIVTEIPRYVVASSSVMHAVALWIAFAHLVQREDLGINISPRLAIQAPDTDCGKTVLLEAVACGVPRPDMLVSISASSLFRSVDADKNTLLIDEVDMLLDEGRNPDLRAVLQGGHRRSSAKVKRTERLTDGSFDPRVYNCFTAIATAGIGALPRTLQNRAIVAFLQRAMACEVREHLVNAESETLIVIRRKLMRWADDLRELPDVDRPRELANRLGDNWHPLRRIAALAGGEWPARAWEAAAGPAAAPAPPGGAMTELLDAVWRVFEASKLPRMLTVDIVTALLDLDEGKWRQVKNGGKAVDEYYLRDRLKDVLPRSKEADKARRWRTAANPSGNRQWGYTLEHHLKEPFLRYLGKGSPLDAPKEAEEETEKGEEGEEGERAGGEPADVKTSASTAPRKGQGLGLRALDLFCCAGGVTKGLQQAGFHVTGVDIRRQAHSRAIEKRERRARREAELGERQRALPDKRYGVVLAEPPWRFQPYSRETGMDRAADHHYPTSTLEEIEALAVASIAAPDCVLFLCATVPMLPQALEVMAAWGFAYKSNFAWGKSRMGTGFWNRNKHELLLIGTRGHVPAPALGTQAPSLIEALVGRHSEKPAVFYEIIERYFPTLPKIELHARGAIARAGWEVWGLEAPIYRDDPQASFAFAGANP
jgi:N6-adenosine-specific RNA methylase IME4